MGFGLISHVNSHVNSHLTVHVNSPCENGPPPIGGHFTVERTPAIFAAASENSRRTAPRGNEAGSMTHLMRQRMERDGGL